MLAVFFFALIQFISFIFSLKKRLHHTTSGQALATVIAGDYLISLSAAFYCSYIAEEPLFTKNLLLALIQIGCIL